jgi:curved DNA-binding protein CbpA
MIEEEPRRYQPREGVDYIVDLYGIAGVASHDAGDDTIRRELDARMLEYHPDRVHGLAPEFQERAARVGQLLTRARKILRDPVRREQYDELLAEWDGPVSTDGTPVITIQRMVEAQAAMMDDDGVRTMLGEVDAEIAGMLGIDPDRIESARRLAAKYPDDSDARDAYEAQLLEQDRMLALQEAKRRELAGGGSYGIEEIGDNRYRVGLGYGEDVAGEIESARTQKLEQERIRAVGGVATRLAILAGEPSLAPGQLEPASTQVSLPVYFDRVTTEITQIAKERENLLRRRLANLQITYPEADLQTEQRDRLLVGARGPQGQVWLAFHYDAARREVTNVEVDEELLALSFAELIGRGYGVATCSLPEQIEPTAIIHEVVNRYYRSPEEG